MGDKREKQKSAAKREQRRLKRLADEGRLVHGVELPLGAVPAEKSQQMPNNSYSPPPDYYVDIEFTCRDCGREEVWSAEQQKWYYEVAKGPLYATAVRCSECRRRRKEQKRGPAQGDPNPIKHIGSMMEYLRQEIEPLLLGAGFSFDGRRRPSQLGWNSVWLDYSRVDILFRCLYDPYDARLVAETMDELHGHRIVVTTEMNMPRTSGELMEKLGKFKSDVNHFLADLQPTAERPDHDPV